MSRIHSFYFYKAVTVVHYTVVICLMKAKLLNKRTAFPLMGLVNGLQHYYNLWYAKGCSKIAFTATTNNKQHRLIL